MRIIILSRSSELYSTRSLFRAAYRRKHHVRVVDHTMCDLVIKNGRNDVFYNGESLRSYEAIIPRIGHTVTHYGAAVIRQFEAMGVVSTVSSEPLVMVRDKLSCAQLLSKANIPVPTTVYANNQAYLHQLSSEITEFPKIIKVISGTHGVGVLKVDDQKMMETMMEAFVGMKQKVLLQEFIKESSGVDIRAFVVDGEIVASMQRIAVEGEFRSNLHRGATARAIKLNKEEAQTALRATHLLGLSVAGVDMLRSKRGPLVLEVNASPGLEGIENYTGVDVAGKIISFLERKYTQK